MTSANVVSNPATASIQPVPGILKHAAPTVCAVVPAAVTLAPGEGLSIDALRALGGCSAGCGQACFFLFDCPSTCFCLRDGDWTRPGTCVPVPGLSTPDRVTFDVKLADDTRNAAAPSVQAIQNFVDPTASDPLNFIRGSKDGEVDMDAVQR